MQEKRYEWTTLIKSLDVKHLFFLDESGVNTDMTRTYGRAEGGERVVGSVPLNTPKKHNDPRVRMRKRQNELYDLQWRDYRG